MADPMLCARSPAGKKALAAILREHDPSFLADLRMLSAALGGTAAVYYRSDNPETMAAVTKAFAKAKAEYLLLRSKNPGR